MYSRNHRAITPPAENEIALSADPHFRGDPTQMNPEQLVVMAASSCQLLSFLAVAAQAGIDVLGYEDEATGTMDESDAPARIGRIELAPTIRVAGGTDPEHVQKLVDEAHRQCYIANSLISDVRVSATIEVV